MRRSSNPRYFEDEAYVRGHYENMLYWAADQPGLDFWKYLLDQPKFDRKSLLLAFVASNENVNGTPNILSLLEAEPEIWDFMA